jgi:tetratricopeptide (TPR) repeat protein
MPRTLSVEEYKELGKRYYGRRDYHKALDAFTEGIDASGGRDIQLYDYKAATYDKLDNSKAALAISRRMIQSFEKDPRVSVLEKSFGACFSHEHAFHGPPELFCATQLSSGLLTGHTGVPQGRPAVTKDGQEAASSADLRAWS